VPGFVELARMYYRQHQQRTAETPGKQLPPFEDLQRTAFDQAVTMLPEGLRRRIEDREATAIPERSEPREDIDFGLDGGS